MEITAIALARVVSFIETLDLNPQGKAYFPNMVPALVERYGFLKFPQKLEDFDEEKGVTFEGGRFESITVQRIQVFSHVLVAETASSTSDSERILEDALTWASGTFGLHYRSGMIKRKAYVSQVIFHSDHLLDKLHPSLLKISAMLNSRVPKYFGRELDYRPAGLTISYDPGSIKSGTSVFSIEPRAEIPYSEHKYFSTAPLPTEEHIELLGWLEKELNPS